MSRITHFFIVALFFTLLLPGCGGGVKTVEVQGKVTHNGKAFANVRGGSVTFTPADGKGKPVYGDVQPDGSFRMKTGEQWGVPVGEYAITVTVYSNDYDGDNSLGQAPPKLLSPPKYNAAATSGLTQTVPAGGITDLTLDLK